MAEPVWSGGSKDSTGAAFGQGEGHSPKCCGIIAHELPEAVAALARVTVPHP